MTNHRSDPAATTTQRRLGTRGYKNPRGDPKTKLTQRKGSFESDFMTETQRAPVRPNATVFWDNVPKMGVREYTAQPKLLPRDLGDQGDPMLQRSTTEGIEE